MDFRMGARFLPALFLVSALAVTAAAAPQPARAGNFDGPPVQIAGGEKQTVELAATGGGTAVFAPIGVLLVAKNGTSVPHSNVVFNCSVPNGTCYVGSSKGGAVIETGTNGVAYAVITVVDGWGNVSVRASRGLDAVTFTGLTVKKPTFVVGALSLTSGGNQQVIAVQPHTAPNIITQFAPLVAHYHGAAPASAANIVFTCTPSCSFGSSQNSITVNPSGSATDADVAVNVTVPSAAVITVKATLTGAVTEPVTATLSAFNPTGPFVATPLTGSGQTVTGVTSGGFTAPIASFATPTVMIKDSHNLPVPMVWVIFTCTTKMPQYGLCAVDASAASTVWQETNASGIATINAFNAQNYKGPITMTAAYAGPITQGPVAVTYPSGIATFTETAK
jgi:hypothetical protein